LTGSGTISGVVTNFGTLAPGNSPGLLTINGSLYLQNSAQLSLDIDGTTQGVGYDFVGVTNFLKLAGILSVLVGTNFVPTSGEVFTVLQFAGDTGAFSNVVSGGRLNTANNAGSFRVDYSGSSVTLSDYLPPGGGIHLAIAIGGGGGTIVISFDCNQGATYRVFYSSDLFNWTEVSSPQFISPTPGVCEWTDDGSQTGGVPPSTPGLYRFYRLSAQ